MSLAPASTTEQTTATEAEERKDDYGSHDAADNDADLGSFAQPMMGSSRDMGR